MPTTIAIQSVTCDNKSDFFDGFDEIWLFAQTDGDAGVKYPSSPVRAKKISKHDNKETWKIEGTDFVGNLRFSEGDIPATPATVTNGSTTEYTVSYTCTSN